MENCALHFGCVFRIYRKNQLILLYKTSERRHLVDY